MTLAKQEAIENHRKMWNWIADELEKGNGDKYLHIVDIKVEYFVKHNIKLKNRPFANCFCCEYTGSNNGQFNCGDCPLKWPNGGTCFGDGINGLYIRAWDACVNDNYAEAAKLARQIANLPEREDV